jgi:DNA (cytosine-5)-methyltransferase 1
VRYGVSIWGHVGFFRNQTELSVNHMMNDKLIYPVVDLFAGPGGLGEGFASLPAPYGRARRAFKTTISIEKDPAAHRTLRLRHFFRGFAPENVPNDYYQYLEGAITLEELYRRYPREASHAQHTAWLCELGEEPRESVNQRISDALSGHKKWVLVGGPPCQAYSKAGRSRMKGNPDFEEDPRHFLYKEYLRILIDHAPPVFVMENVKGLISSQIQGRYVINDILEDLSKPASTVGDDGSGLEYRLYSLSQSGVMSLDADPSAFVVKAEEYGIPQARHRIFIVGIRRDIDIEPRILEKSEKHVTVKDVIGSLPKIRSRLSGLTDSDDLWVEALTEVMHQPWFKHGRENGLADQASLTEEIVYALKQQTFEKRSLDYSCPTTLQNWFGDERLKVLLAHESRSHMQSDLHRYLFASVYAQINHVSPKLRNFPEELLPNHKNVEQGRTDYDFADRFRVQLPDAPATTITSHISKDGHYYIHFDPSQCRSLTVREAARIQTFPDNYRFEGTRTEQYHQVGNAVPPLLSHKIAEIVFEVLEKMDQ